MVQARQNSIGHRSHGLRLLSNTEDMGVTAGGMKKNMDGRDGEDW